MNQLHHEKKHRKNIDHKNDMHAIKNKTNEHLDYFLEVLDRIHHTVNRGLN